MISRKYLRDYTFTESDGKNGRLKTGAVYAGKYYYFIDSKQAKSGGKLLLRLCGLGWIAYLSALVLRSAATKLIFVALPFAFSALALGELTASALLAYHRKEPLKRSDADKLSTRLPGSALWTLLLTGISLLGEGIMAIVSPKNLLPGDAVFSADAVVIFAISLFALSRRAAFRTREQ